VKIIGLEPFEKKLQGLTAHTVSRWLFSSSSL